MDQLLGEAGWVRRIAASLVVGGDEADDLTQEVLLDALRSRRPPAAGRMRAWLGAIARNKARDRYAAAARAAVVIDEAREELQRKEGGAWADERLELQAELAQALRRLPAGPRDLLVRRHVDEIPPRELAKELGISAQEVSRRLHGAKKQLRAELARSERGEEGWRRALGCLALPMLQRVGPEAAAGAGEGVGSLDVSGLGGALPMAAAILLLGAAGWFVVDRIGGEPGELRGDEVGLVRVGAADRPSPAGRAANDRAENRRGERVALASTGEGDVEPVAEPPRFTLRLLDERGELLAGAKGAWTAARGAPRAFEAPEGVLELPVGGFATVFAKHERACLGWIELDDRAEGGEASMVLADRPALDLRVKVDGLVPEAPIRMHFYDRELSDYLEERHAPRRESLEELGVEASLDVATDAQGRIRAELPFDAERAWPILLERWIKIERVDGEPWTGMPRHFPIELDSGPGSLEFASLPHVVGRFVWEDTGEPAVGRAWVHVQDERGYLHAGSYDVSTDATGRFRASIHKLRDPDDELRESLRSDGRAMTQEEFLGSQGAKIRLDPQMPGADGWGVSTFELPPDTAFLDLGHIEVKRLLRARLVVTDEEGSPLRAALGSSRGSSRCDETGEGDIGIAGPEEWVDVFVKGHDFVRVSVAGKDLSEPIHVQLPRAPVLEVPMPTELMDPTGLRDPLVYVSWDERPFGSWHDAAAPRPELGINMYRASYDLPRSTGTLPLQEDGIELKVDPDGVARLYGLRRGVELVVALTDSVGGIYSSQHVVFDGEVELDPWGELEPAMVELEFVNSAGERTRTGRFCVAPDGPSRGTPYRDYEGGGASVGPLAPGPRRLWVLPAELGGNESIENRITLQPGRNALQVDLAEPTR